MSTASCVSCDNEVRPRQEALQCDHCDRWQHRTCQTGLSREFYRKLVKGEVQLPDWKCCRCRIAPTIPAIPAAVNHDNDPITAVLTDIDPFRDDQTSDMDVDASFHVQSEYDIPQQYPENSIDSIQMDNDEDDNEEEDLGDDEPSYTVLKGASIRGKDKLIDSIGYSYTVKWWCSTRNKVLRCPATVIQCGDTFRPGRQSHHHPTELGVGTKIKIVAEAKVIARTDYSKSGSAVLEEAMRPLLDSEDPSNSRPVPDNLVRYVNGVRQALRPEEPKDMDFELLTDFLPENFLVQDVSRDGFRHSIFATPRQLSYLSKLKTWYLDGTFKIVNHPFVQLFSIHRFIGQDGETKQIPLAFCLMSWRRNGDYTKVLQALKDHLPALEVRRFVVDFEAGMWNALGRLFPEAEIKGCVFHWTQAVWRKAQEFGLQTAYMKRDRTYRFVKKLLALPFLLSEHIVSSFDSLKARAPTDTAMTRLLDYIEATWINSTVWTPNSCSVFMSSVRTNNDVEGWHRRMNAKAGRGRIPFYTLLSLLSTEAGLIPLQMRLVSEKKLRRFQRKLYRMLQGKVFLLWEQYVNGEKSTSQLLKACSHLNGPTM